MKNVLYIIYIDYVSLYIIYTMSFLYTIMSLHSFTNYPYISPLKYNISIVLFYRFDIILVGNNLIFLFNLKQCSSI